MYEHFMVYTYHSDIHRLMKITEPSARLTPWLLRLTEYDFQIKQKKGSENAQANALYTTQKVPH